MSERTLKRTGPGAGPQTEPEQEEIPTGSGSRGRLLLVLVAAGVLLVGAGAALFITRGGDEATPSGPTTTATGRPTASASPTASATAATDTASAGRNPFATPDAVTTSSATSSSSSSSTSSATGSAGTAYVAVFEVASDGTAQFGVNGAEFTAEPGETFGDDVKLTYHKTSQVGSQTCAVLSREDTTFTACPGEMHTVD